MSQINQSPTIISVRQYGRFSRFFSVVRLSFVIIPDSIHEFLVDEWSKIGLANQLSLLQQNYKAHQLYFVDIWRNLIQPIVQDFRFNRFLHKTFLMVGFSWLVLLFEFYILRESWFSRIWNCFLIIQVSSYLVFWIAWYFCFRYTWNSPGTFGIDSGFSHPFFEGDAISLVPGTSKTERFNVEGSLMSRFRYTWNVLNRSEYCLPSRCLRSFWRHCNP